MKKNVFQGFENSKLDNLNQVKGGYYWTYKSTLKTDGTYDDELTTEKGDLPDDCNTHNCIDEVSDSVCISTPPPPPSSGGGTGTLPPVGFAG